MNKFRILPPEELKAKAVAKVKAFQLEKRRRQLEEKQIETGDLFVSAILSGDADKVKQMLKRGADVNAVSSTGHTALMAAAFNKNKELVQSLLYAGADVNGKNDNGKTALMVAAGSIQTEVIVRMLVDAGADVNAKNNNGRTALDTAVARMGSSGDDTVEFLKSKGAKEGEELG